MTHRLHNFMRSALVVLAVVLTPNVWAIDDSMKPTLSEPFLNLANNGGEEGYGQFVVIYSSPLQVDSFFTSLDPTKRYCSVQSGQHYEPASDEKRKDFSMTFHVFNTKDSTWSWVESNKVDIPAYHPINYFDVGFYNYRNKEYPIYDMRYKKLEWGIRNPNDTDYMATQTSDMFEIQRAYLSDYSDAQTIAIISYDDIADSVISPSGSIWNKYIYQYIDSTEEAWYNPLQKGDINTIYYRVRRASSSPWGWENHAYAASKSVSCYEQLSSTPYDLCRSAETGKNISTFTLDPDFANNGKVNILFALRFDMFLITGTIGSVTDTMVNKRVYVDDHQKLMLRKIAQETKDTILIEIPKDDVRALYEKYFHTKSSDSLTVDRIYLPYTDVISSPCIHYKYEAYVDTTGVIIKDPYTYQVGLKWDTIPEQFTPIAIEGDGDIYLSTAANINTFSATKEEYPDHVLLTWEPTDGDVGTYKLETRPHKDSAWTKLADGLTQSYYRDYTANPDSALEWEYQLTMTYTCNKNTTHAYKTVKGSRKIYGLVSGRIHYADGIGCPGVTVSASHNDTVVQRVVTDASGFYLLDSLPYMHGVDYAIVPESEHGVFRFNHTSATSAAISLASDHCIATNVDFENTSCVRFSGRVLYENSTIPVRDVNFLVNGVLVMNGNAPATTDVSGDFRFNVPASEGFTLQAIKDGHVFAGNGFVRINGDSVLTLTAPQDGVRIYDQTKVRLIGRLAGGNNQGQKTLGFGLSTNNLGDDLQMVFELEGDNVSQIVHVPSDLSISEIDTVLQHEVNNGAITDTVGATTTLYQKKRIIIRPDLTTGEYEVDLFPVKYKIAQATARGYATLYANGKSSETLDLTNAPLQHQTLTHNGDTVDYNESYTIIYHSPISITCKQQVNGRDVDYYGELEMVRQNLENQIVTIPLAIKQADGSYTYLFGAPVFDTDHRTKTYGFHVTAHEDYYYNNDPVSGNHEEVRLHGGKLKVYNGLHDSINTEIQTHLLNNDGEAIIAIPVDYVSFIKTGEEALRVLDLSVEYENAYTESQAIKAYVTGNRKKGLEFVTYNKGGDYIELLDILRDPPGSNSYAYIEEGTNYTFTHEDEVSGVYGAEITAGVGSNYSTVMGQVAGVPVGTFYGVSLQTGCIRTGSIPITGGLYSKNNLTYLCTTTHRIETGRDPYSVGSSADVFIGIAMNAYCAMTDAVKPIDEVTYNKLKSQFEAGTMHLVAEGTDVEGKSYYLVIGTEAEIGSYITSDFVYTQDYIENTIIKQYEQLKKSTTDSTKIKDYDKAIAQWKKVLLINEKEKLNIAVAMRDPNGDTKITKQDVKRWSVGGTTKVEYSETYEYARSRAYKNYFQGIGFSTENLGLGKGDKNVGITHPVSDGNGESYDLKANLVGSKFYLGITPIVDFDWKDIPSRDSIHIKKAGFVLETDPYGHMDVTVSRMVREEMDFNSDAKAYRDDSEATKFGGNKHLYYGSYVYYLNGGASRCPYEPAEMTRFYTPATKLSEGTLKLENQKIDINVHELSDVPVDQPALFNLRLTNEGEMPYGDGLKPLTFYLRLKEGSNPKGAKILIDGMPLTDGRAIPLTRGEVINKTMEVYAGDGYDFEDIVLILQSSCDIYNQAQCTFSVHYTPVATPVNISMPHDQWVLNTLSARDSTGYYLPVVIDGFDVHYKGFDHIELQYKLVTQSNDDWVNLCSYFYDKNLYEAASGTKAMIKGGRIENVRFYGERDPMEQQYNLRAVAFCRHGNSFIYRSSPVLTGTKDTRPPRVFGAPEPADAVLGVGENLNLRFNEAIAGNYLDEDNNFQVLGTTNQSGITAGTSIHFDGSDNSYAATAIHRSLANKSFTIDMMVRPSKTANQVLFRHGTGANGLVFGIDASNRLYVQQADTIIRSLAIESLTAFTRVACAYDHTTGKVNFYAGTEGKNDDTQTATIRNYNVSAPLIFGKGLDGDLLDVRVWGKALGLGEIANTYMKRLTGYERGLIDYYPMNEGRGASVTDKASGATLLLQGTAWNLQEGIAMRFDGTKSLNLKGELLTRSDIQDMTLMLWFKTDQAQGTLFSATDQGHGTSIGFNDGKLVLNNDATQWTLGDYADDTWHHVVLSISRTFNQASIFVDGAMVQSFAASNIGGIGNQDMKIGADGYKGYIDDIAMYEQALPKSLIRTYDNISQSGEEMGLIGWIPFSDQKENENGIMETVFSPYDRRVARNSDGSIAKPQQLVIGINGQEGLAGIEAFVEKKELAPIREHEHLTKLNFDWAFNGDELRINLKMPDHEINKQNIYVTVRDVEDLRGNPQPSPVTWTTYVDRNALKWEKRSVYYSIDNLTDISRSYPITITNAEGKNHQYTIDNLPDWLEVDASYGSLAPLEEKRLQFRLTRELPVGLHSHTIYLTDENELSEPLSIFLTVEAVNPYEEPDPTKYPMNMSVCGRVMLDGAYDTDTEDKLIVLFYNECVGLASVAFNSASNAADVFLTIYGNESMAGKNLRFLLWQASTGKTISLVPTPSFSFTPSAVLGCGTSPVIFRSGGSETQRITLNAGWNWNSFNLNLNADSTGLVNEVMSSISPWMLGDEIKDPTTQTFCTFNSNSNRFAGPLKHLQFRHTYMIYSAKGNTIYVNGDKLPADSMYITLKGDGNWSAFPCLFTEPTLLTEALADYYDNATPEDLIKSHDHFAVFSQDKHWVGDLTTLRPGEGYLFLRQGKGNVKVKLFNQDRSAERAKTAVLRDNSQHSALSAKAASNMTMIAKINGENGDASLNGELRAYIGEELVGIAQPMYNVQSTMSNGEAIYFLTISSDIAGELRFETEDGIVLQPVELTTSRHDVINYQADSHHGSLKKPVILVPSESDKPYKIIENDHVIIIRNGERYDVTGKKLTK